ncbi:hypothetical protein [Rathayibacter rathayi]|uniref:hypothetical protein n=1 Tax=Rathayibacter rathayi TaxID=33887 RepID=UPI000FD99B10|nr:hypothetical protein [Rathayibacter rathayi]MWV75976.1 hypothetical protein [Rathayibacter rathayi NCPPB 2980 = VKM Ac-1601]
MATPTDPPRAERIPDEVAVAVRVIGSEINKRILRFLLQLPDRNRGSHFGPIHQALPDFSSMSIRRHLKELESVGVVLVDTPEADRHGRSPRYSVDAPFLRRLYAQSEAWLFSETNDQPSVEL